MKSGQHFESFPQIMAVLNAQALPTGPFRFIALDVETACGDSGSICQIGLACVGADNRIETWASYVDPEQRFAAFNIELHGIELTGIRVLGRS